MVRSLVIYFKRKSTGINSFSISYKSTFILFIEIFIFQFNSSLSSSSPIIIHILFLSFTKHSIFYPTPTSFVENKEFPYFTPLTIVLLFVQPGLHALTRCLKRSVSGHNVQSRLTSYQTFFPVSLRNFMYYTDTT